MRAEAFFNFMKAREQVRVRKDAGLPRPWTDDPILQRYKFTNVKREHDRTTREFREIYRANELTAVVQEHLFNCAFNRYFGTYEFAQAVGWQKLKRVKGAWTWPGMDRVRDIAVARMAEGERVFTGAYIITNNGIKGAKHDVVTKVFLTDLLEKLDVVVSAAQERWQWQQAAEALRHVRGFGGSGFMAKETLLDTFFTPLWPAGTPYDRNTWTPVGPGSKRGAWRVIKEGDDPGAGLSEEKTLELCRALFQESKVFWPADHVELELTDIQFQLCEFDKYERTRLGQGTPRSRYNGV